MNTGFSLAVAKHGPSIRCASAVRKLDCSWTPVYSELAETCLERIARGDATLRGLDGQAKIYPITLAHGLDGDPVTCNRVAISSLMRTVERAQRLKKRRPEEHADVELEYTKTAPSWHPYACSRMGALCSEAGVALVEACAESLLVELRRSGSVSRV